MGKKFYAPTESPGSGLILASRGAGKHGAEGSADRRHIGHLADPPAQESPPISAHAPCGHPKSGDPPVRGSHHRLDGCHDAGVERDDEVTTPNAHQQRALQLLQRITV
ncbi:MAG: hypothetical protein ACRETD_02225 [Steroidobacteraceae bacterium]